MWPQIFHYLPVGWEAAAAGLQPGQVILKVNGNNVNLGDFQEVLEHFSAQHTHQEPPETVRGHICPSKLLNYCVSYMISIAQHQHYNTNDLRFDWEIWQI